MEFNVLFLSVLAFVWISFAVIFDLKKREIPNWLNFSLIIFAIGFRFFYSLFLEVGFAFFYQGLIGLGIFFVFGNLFYYCRVFAGGDAKLMFALGTIIPFSNVFEINIVLFVLFLFLFFFSGAVYSLFSSSYLVARNFKKFKKEFFVQSKKNKKLILGTCFLAILIALGGFFDSILFCLSIFVFVLPYLYVSAKAIDECCMIKKVSPNKITEGDWLYQDVKLNGKTIKKSWDGLSKEEIRLLKKHKKKVLIRYGVPFSPSFLLAFIIFVYFWFSSYWKIFFLGFF